MLTPEYNEFSAQSERYEGSASAVSEPCSQEDGASEAELCCQELGRYDDEEIVTKPWPPLRW